MFNYLYNQTDIFFMIYLRVIGVVAVMPIIGGKNVPARVKIGMAFFIAIIAYPIIHNSMVAIPQAFTAYVFMCITEILIGLAIGFVSALFMGMIYLTGQLIDTPMGFGMAHIFNPEMQFQAPLIGQYLYLLFALIFFVINGHHAFLHALFDSFQVIPLGEAVFSPELSITAVNVFRSMFMIGFRMAFPVVASIFLVEVGLGIISRAVPQMNILVVGFPVRIGVGFIILIITIPFIIGASKGFFELIYDYVYEMILRMAS